MVTQDSFIFSDEIGEHLLQDNHDSEDDQENLDPIDTVNYWKNNAYWRLPENVRAAIDTAKLRSRHTDFWYRLEKLNDKIYVYRQLFYNKMPNF